MPSNTDVMFKIGPLNVTRRMLIMFFAGLFGPFFVWALHGFVRFDNLLLDLNRREWALMYLFPGIGISFFLYYLIIDNIKSSKNDQL